MAVLLALAGFAVAAQPRPGNVTAINHVAFMVKSLDTSRAFYYNIINLDTIPEPFHDGIHAWFRIGPQAALHLIQGPFRQQSIKQSHLCFSVSSVEVFVAKLKNLGIAFENWLGIPGQITTRVDGVKQIYLQDPDGYWLEINDEK